MFKTLILTGHDNFAAGILPALNDGRAAHAGESAARHAAAAGSSRPSYLQRGRLQRRSHSTVLHVQQLLLVLHLGNVPRQLTRRLASLGERAFPHRTHFGRHAFPSLLLLHALVSMVLLGWQCLLHSLLFLVGTLLFYFAYIGGEFCGPIKFLDY